MSDMSPSGISVRIHQHPKTGLVTIDWGTKDGKMPVGGFIAVPPELIAKWVRVQNALLDAERMLGVVK